MLARSRRLLWYHLIVDIVVVEDLGVPTMGQYADMRNGG